MTLAPAEVAQAFAGMRQLLQADGYDLAVNQADASGIILAITAGADACADCLVPPAIMEMYARDALKDMAAWRDAPIAFLYPAKAG